MDNKMEKLMKGYEYILMNENNYSKKEGLMFLVVSENGNGDITVWKHSKTLKSANNFCKKVTIENETVSILVIKKDYM